MVMRVFPVVGMTAPRLPFEKSYTFFIVPSLFGVCLPHRDDSHVLAAGRVNHNHQRPERIHSDGHEALLTLSAFIFNGEGERVVEYSVALGKGYAVLLEVCRILLRVELGGHSASICTRCIYVNEMSESLCVEPLTSNEPDPRHPRTIRHRHIRPSAAGR